MIDPPQDMVPLAPSIVGSFEDFLGPAEHRYFGRGYRRTRYAVTADGAGGGVFARVEPDAEASGGSFMPHLTSTDAIALPLLLVDCAREAHAAPETLRSVTITAGSAPWVALDRVPVSVYSAPDGSGRIVRARTGSFRTQLHLVPAVARTVDGGAESVYGSAFRDIEVNTWLSSVTPDAVLGTHKPDFSRAPARASGTDSAVWPGLTAITYVAIMGQLTQVALLAATGRGRRETGNLWMRRMSIDLSQRRQPSTDAVTTETRVTDRRAVRRQDPSLQTVEVRSVSSEGVVALASLAYREAS